MGASHDEHRRSYRQLESLQVVLLGLLGHQAYSRQVFKSQDLSCPAKAFLVRELRNLRRRDHPQLHWTVRHVLGHLALHLDAREHLHLRDGDLGYYVGAEEAGI